MSKVRNALRMAGTWPQEQASSPAHPALVSQTKAYAEPEMEPESERPALLDQPAPQRSILARFFRRIRRWMGLRAGGPVPRCNSVTRRGLPCRAPAMANGFCRMHGGANTPPRGRSRERFSEAVHEQYETAARFVSIVLSRFVKS
jgi:hypothetical protein